MTVDIQKILAIVGTVTPLASILSSKVNQQIRELRASDQDVPKWLLQMGILLNLFAINADKVGQYRNMSKN